jgi:hypothetical protein
MSDKLKKALKYGALVGAGAYLGRRLRNNNAIKDEEEKTKISENLKKYHDDNYINGVAKGSIKLDPEQQEHYNKFLDNYNN